MFIMPRQAGVKDQTEHRIRQMILKPQLYYVLLSLYTFPVMSFGRGMLIVFFGLGLSSEPLAAIGV